MSEKIVPNSTEPWALQERALTSEHAEMLSPKHTLVVVVDAQKSYTDPNEGVAKLTGQATQKLEALAPNLANFLKFCRTHNIKTAWTRYRENPEDVAENFRKKMQIDDTPPLAIPGSRAWEYTGEGRDEADPLSEIKPEEGESEFVKTTYNVFGDVDKSTGLREYCQEQGIKTLVLVGAYTSRCVQSSAVLAADFYKYNVFIPRDLVGNLDNDWAEEQDGALSSMGTILGYVPYSHQITEIWAKQT